MASSRRHGHAGAQRSGEYFSWQAMVQRCTNARNKRWNRYGGRGIRVYPAWIGRGGFDLFIAHIGLRPSPKHSIDRIDNDGHYEPGNVRWATRATQAANTRRNRVIEFGGQSLTISEWARRLGLNVSTLDERLKRGWRIERALSSRAVAPTEGRNARLITIGRERLCISQWAARNGLSAYTVVARLRRGWSIEKALSTKPVRAGGGG